MGSLEKVGAEKCLLEKGSSGAICSDDPQSPVQSALTEGSIPDQIKKLAELRDSGILTEGEFVTKKTELLQKM